MAAARFACAAAAAAAAWLARTAAPAAPAPGAAAVGFDGDGLAVAVFGQPPAGRTVWQAVHRWMVPLGKGLVAC